MAVKIRLRREGKKKQPYYRVVVADVRAPRDGGFIDDLGYYQPLHEPSTISIDRERALKWLRDGAQPSDAVRKLLRIEGIWEEFRPGDPGRDRSAQHAARAAKAAERESRAREEADAARRKREEAEAAEAQAAAAEEQAAAAQAEADVAPDEDGPAPGTADASTEEASTEEASPPADEPPAGEAQPTEAVTEPEAEPAQDAGASSPEGAAEPEGPASEGATVEEEQK